MSLTAEELASHVEEYQQTIALFKHVSIFKLSLKNIIL